MEGSPHQSTFVRSNKILNTFIAQSLNCRQAQWSLFLSRFRFTYLTWPVHLNKESTDAEVRSIRRGGMVIQTHGPYIHQFFDQRHGPRSPAPKKTYEDAIKEIARYNLLAIAFMATRCWVQTPRKRFTGMNLRRSIIHAPMIRLHRALSNCTMIYCFRTPGRWRPTN